GDASPDSAQRDEAVNTLKGVHELSSSDRSALDAETAEWFDDFVNDPDAVLSDYGTDRPDRLAALVELKDHLPKEEAPLVAQVLSVSEPVDFQEAEIIEEDGGTTDATLSHTPTLAGVSPDAAVAPRPSNAGLTLSSPPSSEVPAATLALIATPGYKQNAQYLLDQALPGRGQLPPHLSSYVENFQGDVGQHLRNMLGWVRQNKHITDSETFKKVFGVTLPTT
ncbi:MAG: hypothetical protein P8J32_08800, partial [bacterium]|nr:hypothetical protein [bacterium]